MQKVKITEADIRNCDPYIPIMDKTMMVINCAQYCASEAEIKGDDGQPLPSMWRENRNLSSRFLMGIFAKAIMGKDFDPIEGTEYLMSADEYDRWAGAYVINQIERFKVVPELRDRCYDIISEYRDVAGRLNAEIRANIEAMNDVITRGGDMLRASLTPQAMQAITDNMADINRMADELAERRKNTPR